MARRTLLLHGSADQTVPVRESMRMTAALQQRKVPVECKVYPEETHTSLFIEGPMAGLRDIVVEDVLAFIAPGQYNDAALDLWPLIPLFPRTVCALAGVICPF